MSIHALRPSASPFGRLDSFSIEAAVDPRSGDLLAGNLLLTGSVTLTEDFSGTLLTAHLTEFGFLDLSNGDAEFDFRATVTGGDLAFLYPGGDIAVIVASEGSGFTGSFTADFSGGAKGALGALCDLEVEKTCIVPPPPSNGNDCQGKVLSLKLEYTGEGCGATTNPQAGKAKCEGGASFGEPVDIRVTDNKGNKVFAEATGVLIGDVIEVLASNAGSSNLPADTKVVIDNGLETIKFHTSCSKVLNVDDLFGSVRAVQLTTTEGGTVTLPDPEPPVGAEECTIPGTPPTPHCQGKLEVLRLRYNGGDCTLSKSQDGKATCRGDAMITEQVRIEARNKRGSAIFLQRARRGAREPDRFDWLG